MTFNVTLQEAQAILKILGQMPTQSGAYPLFTKLGQQYEEATTNQTDDVEELPVPATKLENVK